jgi:transcription antitermination factor NusG
MYNTKLTWLVLRTKPGNTKKVTEYLDRLGIQNYLPLNCYDYEFAEKRKRVYKPLFENWIFVRPAAQVALETLQEIRGVVNFIYWHDHPAVIPDADSAIKKMILNSLFNLKPLTSNL